MTSPLQETRAAIRATPAWLGQTLQSLIGSRFFVGVSGIFFISFLAHAKSAPDRLPPFAGVNPALVMGFAPQAAPAPLTPPPEVRDQARDAAQAGLPYVLDFVNQFLAATPQAIPHINFAGLGASALCLLLGLYLLARQESRRA